MNRELRFRAWIVTNYPEPMLNEPYMAIQGNPDLETLQSFMHHYGDEPKLMQFTGLKDKNNIDIYEGDIVNAAWMHHGEPGEQFRAFIIYNEHTGSYRIGYDSLGGGSQDEIYPRYQVEVIGNIYENKNLLIDE
jgi:uncharacterized phage protein (TIGR01671 family)